MKILRGDTAKNMAVLIDRCRRQGKFIYVWCPSPAGYKKICAQAKASLSLKRGVYTYKGILVVTKTDRHADVPYFDEYVCLKKK